MGPSHSLRSDEPVNHALNAKSARAPKLAHPPELMALLATGTLLPGRPPTGWVVAAHVALLMPARGAVPATEATCPLLLPSVPETGLASAQSQWLFDRE